jgi:Fe-S cluster biogenesis protein NfuA
MFPQPGEIVRGPGSTAPPKTRRTHRKTVAAAGTSVAPVTMRGMAMISRERVESVLNRVRPFLQADGGDIELMAVNGNSAEVRLSGMCAGCPSAHMTLHVGVESALREEIPEFETLRLV